MSGVSVTLLQPHDSSRSWASDSEDEVSSPFLKTLDKLIEIVFLSGLINFTESDDH